MGSHAASLPRLAALLLGEGHSFLDLLLWFKLHVEVHDHSAHVPCVDAHSTGPVRPHTDRTSIMHHHLPGTMHMHVVSNVCLSIVHAVLQLLPWAFAADREVACAQAL